MIDLDNTRLVLYDFDDTLCIHSKHTDSIEEEAEYDRKVLMHGSRAWEECEASPHMKKFMDLCKDKGITQGLISATTSIKHMQGKEDWVADAYGIRLENFCVGTYEGKLRIMIAIADAYGIKREQMLIVDDFWENLERVANAGFMACSPMEVVNYVYKL